MASFGKQVSAGNPAARPTFGKKTTPPPAGRFSSAPKEKLSPEALAFLQSERSRAPEAPAVKSRAPALPSYAAPAGAASAFAGKPVWGRRVVALLIDSLIVGVPIFFFFGLGIFGAAAGASSETEVLIAIITFSLILGVTSIVYSVVTEASKHQATYGKRIVGAVVTDVHGGKPTLGAIIMRNTVGRFCSNLIPFYIGYFIGLFREDRRCIHDLIAGTMVRQRAKEGAPANYGDVFA